MKIPENSTEGASTTTGSGRDIKGRGKLDVNKWPIDHLIPRRTLNTGPFFSVPDNPFYNFHPMRPSGKEPPFENTPNLQWFDKYPPKPEWPAHLDTIQKDLKIDFKYLPPPPPPHVSGSPMALNGGAAGGVMLLLAVARYMRGKASCTRRASIGAGAVQPRSMSISTDEPSIPSYPRRPSEQGEPGRPLNNDLPPPYYDEPPPDTYSKDAEPKVHTRRQNAFIENGLRADAVATTTTSNDSEDVTPGMKTELVFDNGRIVERLSLDLNSNNKETEVTSKDNVEQQSTSHANVKDRVVYVDETDNVKLNTQ